MIRFKNISLRRGSYLLFDNFSTDIHDGEKIGLVGDNGTGKTSLFFTLLGEIAIDQGDMELPESIRISHVDQQTPDNQRSAMDHVLDGDKEYRKLINALEQIDGMSQPQTAELYVRMDEIDGYSAPARAAKILSGLGFKTNEHSNPTSSFSGGWRVRLNLAKSLMAPSDLLLLDEPTNHLDLDTIIWLEDWLQKYTGTLFLISHDREFIDACCRRILHIENKMIKSYNGNYSQFERQRAKALANDQAMYEKQQRKIVHIENYIRRFRYKADKAKQAQSRIRALEKMQLIVPAHVGSSFSFSFKPCHRVSDPILKLENVDIGYDNHIVLSGVNLSIAPGDRIGLLGKNGAGKSTLIKTMAAVIRPFCGVRLESKHLNIGYFAQHQLEQLDGSLTPMKQFHQLYPEVTTKDVRQFLGGFDFRGKRVDEKIEPFSGGEKARLALALIIYKAPNLLLLDEPTNHLDMEMRHALNLAIQNYEGAIILVSHDRSLINSVTDQLVLISNGRVEVFKDDMETYIRILKQSNSDKLQKIRVNESHSEKLTKKQRRQIAANQRQQLKPKREQVKKLESKMQHLQKEIEALDQKLNDPQTYETESTANLAEMMQEKSDKAGKQKSLEEQWYEAIDSLEELERKIEMG